jgi:hypothetical protein
MRWSCPNCGYITKSQLNQSNFYVECKNDRCDKPYAWGFHFYEMAPGPKSPPPDIIIPSDPMREGEFKPTKWHSKDTVHEVTEPES